MDKEIYNRLKEIKPTLEKYKISRLRLFGSHVRDDYKADSDVDLLVEFDEMPSLFELLDIQEDIESKINKKVDLVFPHKIFPEFRTSILNEAVDV